MPRSGGGGRSGRSRSSASTQPVPEEHLLPAPPNPKSPIPPPSHSSVRSFSESNTKPDRTRPSQVTLDKDKSAASSNSSVSGVLPVRVDLKKVREAKRFVVLQAQHEGCLGSYKSFDSLFGNYLVPVIPSNGVSDQIGTK